MRHCSAEIVKHFRLIDRIDSAFVETAHDAVPRAAVDLHTFH